MANRQENVRTPTRARRGARLPTASSELSVFYFFCIFCILVFQLQSAFDVL